MSKERPGVAWTESDTEALFATLGRYLIIFQLIESYLDRILLLAWGHENWSQGQAKLAKMTNEKKIDAVKEVILTSSDFARVHTRPEWCTHFQSIIERLHEERTRRNMIMHSQYIFDFIEIGMAPLMSNRKKVDGNAIFDRQELSREVQEAMLHEVSELAIAVNFIHVQSVADYRAPFHPRPAS